MEQHGVKLTKKQIATLRNALKRGVGATLRLSKASLMGPHVMYFSSPQLSKMGDAYNKGKGAVVKITHEQLKKSVEQSGDGVGDFLKGVGDVVVKGAKTVGKAVLPVAKKHKREIKDIVVPGAAVLGSEFGPLGAAAGAEVANLGIDALLGDGMRGGQAISTADLDKLKALSGAGITSVGSRIQPLSGRGIRSVGAGVQDGGAVAGTGRHKKQFMKNVNNLDPSNPQDFAQLRLMQYGLSKPENFQGDEQGHSGAGIRSVGRGIRSVGRGARDDFEKATATSQDPAFLNLMQRGFSHPESFEGGCCGCR